MNNFKKLILAVTVFVLYMALGTNNAQAATSETSGFTVDEDIFFVDWYESGWIVVKQGKDSNEDCCKKGTKLGMFEYRAALVTSKRRIDGKYYQRVIIETSVAPQPISGSLQGMTQDVSIWLTRTSAMKNTAIEPESSSGSTEYSITGSLGLGGVLGVQRSGNEYTRTREGQLSLGISASKSYKQDSLVIMTNYNYGGDAYWNYDYISSGCNSAQNAALFGSSKQYSLFSWETVKNQGSFVDGIPMVVKVTFGAGNRKTNKRVGNYLNSKNYELGYTITGNRLYYGDYSE